MKKQKSILDQDMEGINGLFGFEQDTEPKEAKEESEPVEAQEEAEEQEDIFNFGF